ncbi:unnamed protein product [Caenorhabditis auriculariae]|uniref:TRPM-like domain-containing protein n=1 Tax=Caenorhabditis auriculariae TaxID=2777116 RepID=A0A8S1GX00_9PELO|nr:unnamed protein product [Caenorhabditis auriculariae]
MDESEAPIPDLSLTSDTVPVLVGGDSALGGIQLCPALLLGSPQALPGASKHIYSRLAAAASEVDQGVPDLIFCLTSHGNQLSTKYQATLENAIAPFLKGCGVWLISSGEVSDPLARVASATIRNVLPQLEHSAEVLHVVVNSDAVIAHHGCANDVANVVDTSLNTLLMLCRGEVGDGIAKLRASAAVKLAHPPPALLIGVPSEAMSPSSGNPQSAPILLSPSNDKRPLPVAIFAGASKQSLQELLVYVENGVPVIVLQDSCELCALLHSCALLLDSANFSHSRFVDWLREQTTLIDLPGADHLIVKIFSVSNAGDTRLLEFIDVRKLHDLTSMVVDRCLDCYTPTGEDRQVLMLAAKLNTPSVLAAMDMASQLDEELLTLILCECVSKDDQLNFLSSVLQLNPPIRVTSNMLIRMMHHADEHFFTAIVLCQCMGYSFIPTEVNGQFASDVENLVKRLSFGVDNLFPSNAFCNDLPQRDNDESIKILAIWSLLLHRPSIVQCLAAFAEEPIAFGLVLSRIAKSLAHESHDWYFYEQSLNTLSTSLADSATQLLDVVYKSSPAKAYQLLCQPIDTFYGYNVTQLAFQCNARNLIAHECCQRWLHRKLYGNLQAHNSPAIIPKWLKIIISAVFLIPIRFLMLIRPKSASGSKTEQVRISPTVALLDAGRQPKRTRAISTYSVISSRSEALTAITAPLSTTLGFNSAFGGGADSATPQSMVFPLNIEDIDGDRTFVKKSKIRRAAAPSLSTFYSTPIVKYWLSLLFRILFIVGLAYSALLPGCGSNVLDTVFWVCSFFWWIESVYVLAVQAQRIPLSLMPWRVFDVVAMFIFLILLLFLRVFPIEPILDVLQIHSIYPAKVISSFFVLYVSYSTLFFYIPLSEIFGPMVVRVKLMLLRDFTNFLFMIALVMLSSAVAIQGVVFPDRQLTFEVAKKMLSWIWLSLFTTDLSNLEESDTCRKSFLGSPKQYCSAVGGHANPTCPAQTWPAYLVVIEYFVLLKLLLWPILFAFFAKTAKSVDDEADKIWRFQLYTLAEDFRLRAPLPPPLTLLCVLCTACCRMTGSLSGVFAYDHPDMDSHKDRHRSTWRFGSIYRNPSVPFKKNSFSNSFWRRLSIDRWRAKNQKSKASSEELDELGALHNYLRLMTLRSAYEKTSSTASSERMTMPYPNSDVLRVVITRDQRPWDVLLPKYNPPFFCKAVEQFPSDILKHVDVASEQNVSELRRFWRSRQTLDFATAGPNTKSWALSAAGFPLNPNGRRGIAGRGNHPKFGANRRCFYVILTGTRSADAKVLVDNNRSLPNEWHLEQNSKDEHLASILKSVGVSDVDAQMFSMRRLDSSLVSVGETMPVNDTSPAHLASELVETDDDTDNAWAEHDVWAVSLRDRRILTNVIGFSWCPIGSAQNTLPAAQTAHVSRATNVYSITR